MKILAIETSCDDTAVAIFEVKGEKIPKFTVLANVVSSQTIHQNYGGVFPMMAKREHQQNLVPVFVRALKQAKLLNSKLQTTNYKQIPNSKLQIIKEILKKETELFDATIKFLQTHKKPKVDFIAVTNGPGLEPCLWVGVNFAKVLSYVWDIPVIPVNHIEGHILVNFIYQNSKFKIQNSKLLPAVALVVSGGHTQLILVKGVGKYEIIGETRDDAAGECFDKCARILGLEYPGGPEIARIAAQFQPSTTHSALASQIKLPRPMINSKDYDFSFSGLKTAVLYATRDYKNKHISNSRELEIGLDKQFISDMCFEIQQSIIDVLIKKTLNATKNYKAKTIILGGGVSANKELRKQLAEKISVQIPNTKYLIPDTALSTDNALMIAVAGYYNKTKKIAWQNLSADANLRVGAN